VVDGCHGPTEDTGIRRSGHIAGLDRSAKDGRLAVKSSGTYSEADPAQDVFKLSWNVDLDLPVKRDVRR
jgi:hypothetical protein